MENYTEQFKSLKGSRTLQWKPHLGLVDMELELEDRKLSFTVTPARASTIMYFQQQRKFSCCLIIEQEIILTNLTHLVSLVIVSLYFVMTL